MAHRIKAIITSFKYDGTLPHVTLVDNFCLIPATNNSETIDSEEPIAPYEEFTPKVRKCIEELSHLGKCAYVETEYFGGIGAQVSETWQNGKRIDGPLVSYDGIENANKTENVMVVEASINQTLKNLGVTSGKEIDEFDTIGLGMYRSNKKVMEEYKKSQK